MVDLKKVSFTFSEQKQKTAVFYIWFKKNKITDKFSFLACSIDLIQNPSSLPS